jgi:uncharacterized membrane protein YcaP (DUF421 family)
MEIDADVQFQRRFWIGQRVGWFVIGILVLLLIVAEATQQRLIGDDFSITKAMLLILTLVGIDIGFSLLKDRSRLFHKMIEGVPLVVVEDGRMLDDRMRWARIDAEDVLQAARERQGLERMEQIKYAVLERTGEISIIPKTRGDHRVSF